MDEQRDSSLFSPAVHPLQAAAHTHRTTNFFIDNILRADFGCRSAQGPGAHASPAGALPRPDSSCSTDSTVSSSPACTRHSEADDASGVKSSSDSPGEASGQQLPWPAWVYCTRYSDRPSSGPRTRKLKKKKNESEDKRPRTAFTAEQLQRLKTEFQISRYITEQRRQMLAHELQLNESQIKIWFQNKRAKVKKASGLKNSLALQLMAQGLYNHSTNSSSIQEEEDGH